MQQNIWDQVFPRPHVLWELITGGSKWGGPGKPRDARGLRFPRLLLLPTNAGTVRNVGKRDHTVVTRCSFPSFREGAWYGLLIPYLPVPPPVCIYKSPGEICISKNKSPGAFVAPGATTQSVESIHEGLWRNSTKLSQVP